MTSHHISKSNLNATTFLSDFKQSLVWTNAGNAFKYMKMPDLFSIHSSHKCVRWTQIPSNDTKYFGDGNLKEFKKYGILDGTKPNDWNNFVVLFSSARKSSPAQLHCR